jgi:hypothetical protein
MSSGKRPRHGATSERRLRPTRQTRYVAGAASSLVTLLSATAMVLSHVPVWVVVIAVGPFILLAYWILFIAISLTGPIRERLATFINGDRH